MAKEITVNRPQLMKFQEDLVSLQGVEGKVFTYFLKRNIEKINQVFRQTQNWAIRQQGLMKGDMENFHKAHQALTQEHAEKDINGNNMPDQFGGVKIKDIDLYNVALESVKEKFPKESAQMEKFEEAYRKHLEAPVTVNLYTIDFKDIPDNISLEAEKVIGFLVDNAPIVEKEELQEIEDLNFEEE